MSEFREFTVSVALNGVSAEQATEIMPWMQEQLTRYSHFKSPTLSWDESNRRIILRTKIDDNDSSAVGKWVANDLWKLAWAALQDPEGLEVVILSVE